VPELRAYLDKLHGRHKHEWVPIPGVPADLCKGCGETRRPPPKMDDYEDE
jgi:hypothetical protein